MADEKPRHKRTDDKHQRDGEFERFEEALETLLQVTKEEVDEKRREWERKREQEKRAG